MRPPAVPCVAVRGWRWPLFFLPGFPLAGGGWQCRLCAARWLFLCVAVTLWWRQLHGRLLCISLTFILRLHQGSELRFRRYSQVCLNPQLDLATGNLLNACRPGFSKDSRKFNALCFTVDGGAFTSGRHDLLNATQFYSDVCAALPEAESRVAIDVDLAAEPDVTARDAAAGSASTATANSTAAGAAAAAAAGDQ